MKMSFKTKRNIHKMFQKYQKEKKKCAKLYSDWRDDEYNLLHNKFIWGITEEGSTSASFSTCNTVYVYYNRVDKYYYLSIDVSAYSDMDIICQKLESAFISFHKNIYSYTSKEEVKNINYSELTQNMFFNECFYKCQTLQEVYFKLRILTIGLNQYWQSAEYILDKSKN